MSWKHKVAVIRYNANAQQWESGGLSGTMTSILDASGAEGWELVGIVPEHTLIRQDSHDVDAFRVAFKRSEE